MFHADVTLLRRCSGISEEPSLLETLSDSEGKLTSNQLCSHDADPSQPSGGHAERITVALCPPLWTLCRPWPVEGGVGE